MDAKLFRGFTPYLNAGKTAYTKAEILASLSDYEATDPMGSQWRTLGFVPVDTTGEFAIDINGAGWLCCVQINERNLPGAVLREEVLKRMAKYKEETGRDKLSKKQIMEIKDDVVLELLPKAFIRRKQIPIMFIGDYVVPFSTSAKVCDDAMAMLMACVAGVDSVKPVHLLNLITHSVPGVLTTLAKDGQSTMAEEGDGVDRDFTDIDYLSTTTIGTMKGPNKQMISVKDKDMSSHDVQELLKQEYTVVKLGLAHVHAGDIDADAAFTLNDKLAFSQLKLAAPVSVRGTDKQDDADTAMATAYLVAVTLKDIINTTVTVLGGIRADEPQATANLADLVPDQDAFGGALRTMSADELDDEL